MNASWANVHNLDLKAFLTRWAGYSAETQFTYPNLDPSAAKPSVNGYIFNVITKLLFRTTVNTSIQTPKNQQSSASDPELHNRRFGRTIVGNYLPLAIRTMEQRRSSISTY